MLELKGISFIRGNKIIIDNLDAAASAGEITVLLGANGSGKTSLLSCIAGILKNSAGEICIDGITEDTDSGEWYRKISYVFDDGGTIPLLTIEEQLILQCLVNDIPKDQGRVRVDYIIDLLNLEKHRTYRADELSAGLRKKLGIGLGIIRDADIFLFDEPFSSLDFQAATTVLELLNWLKKEGKTVVLSTHSPDFVADILDSIWHLTNGRITTYSHADDLTPLFGTGKESAAEAFNLPWMVKS